MILKVAVYGPLRGSTPPVGNIDAMVGRADIVTACIDQALATGEPHCLSLITEWAGRSRRLVARIYPSGTPGVAIMVIHELNRH